MLIGTLPRGGLLVDGSPEKRGIPLTQSSDNAYLNYRRPTRGCNRIDKYIQMV